MINITKVGAWMEVVNGSNTVLLNYNNTSIRVISPSSNPQITISNIAILQPPNNFTVAGVPVVSLNDFLSKMNGLFSDVFVAGGAPALLDDITDVSITNVQLGQYLSWNGSSWVNSPAPSGANSTSSSSATNLDSLTDVAVNSPVLGQIIQFNGSGWVNASLPASNSGGASNLDALTDVVLSAPQLGQVLKFNGTNWYNGADNAGTGGNSTSSGGGLPVSFVNARSASYGAVGNGQADDYAAIQAAVNYARSNAIHYVFLPAGDYKITQPLIMDNGQADGFQTVHLIGESSQWNAVAGTNLFPTFKNAPALGIQRGKGNKIRGITFRGLFTTPFQNNQHAFWNSTLANFRDETCLDTRYAVYAAIVIDFATNTGAYNPAIHYPGLAAYYGRGGTENSGSTGIEIEDCYFSNFAVGICSSPNGETRNAEITLIRRCYFQQMKICISGNEDQEKANRIEDISCWEATHTIFATRQYGSQGPGNWALDGLNIAGGVVQLVQSAAAGYFPSYFKNVYAENLGKIGVITGSPATSFEDCLFDFTYPEYASYQISLISGSPNVTYNDCSFRYYGNNFNVGMPIDGAPAFMNCFFSGMPIKTGSDQYIPQFFNCKVDRYALGANIPIMENFPIYTYGKAKSVQKGDRSYYQGMNEYLDFPEANHFSIFLNTQAPPFSANTTIGGNFSRNLDVNVGAAAISAYQQYAMVAFLKTGGGIQGASPDAYGFIQNIVGSTLTINYISSGFIDGQSYLMYPVYPVMCPGSFLGDVISQTEITNVRFDTNASPADYLYCAIRLGTGVNGFSIITGWNDTTKTFKLFNNQTIGFQASSFGTQYFGCGSMKRLQSESDYDGTLAELASSTSTATILQKGMKVIEQALTDRQTRYLVTESGFTTLLGSETRKASWIREDGTTIQNLSGTTAINMNVNRGASANVTLNGNVSFLLSKLVAGQSGYYVANILQDGVGGRSITWSNSIRWKSGSAPVLQTAPGALDVISFEWNGSFLIGNYASYGT
jgi:hypothetical protein